MIGNASEEDRWYIFKLLKGFFDSSTAKISTKMENMSDFACFGENGGWRNESPIGSITYFTDEASFTTPGSLFNQLDDKSFFLDGDVEKDAETREISDYVELLASEMNLFENTSSCSSEDAVLNTYSKEQPTDFGDIAELNTLYQNQLIPPIPCNNQEEISYGDISSTNFLEESSLCLNESKGHQIGASESPTGMTRNVPGFLDGGDICASLFAKNNRLFSPSDELQFSKTVNYKVTKFPTDPPRRRAANNKEKCRTHNVNTAFQKLRMLIPTDPVDRKLSKVETLRLAISYINHLGMTLHSEDWEEQPCLKGRTKFKGNCSPSLDGVVCTFCMGKSKATAV